ncbi:amidase family protein, partial [Streptococcus suis]
QQANICGQPAISLPNYVRADGLPIGIQLTASNGREDLLLRLADQMEAAGLLNLEGNSFFQFNYLPKRFQNVNL